MNFTQMLIVIIVGSVVSVSAHPASMAAKPLSRNKRFIGGLLRFLFPSTERPVLVPNYPIFKIRRYTGYEIKPIHSSPYSTNAKVVAIKENSFVNKNKIETLLSLNQPGVDAVYNLVSTGIIPGEDITFSAPIVVPDGQNQTSESDFPEKAPIPMKETNRDNQEESNDDDGHSIDDDVDFNDGRLYGRFGGYP